MKQPLENYKTNLKEKLIKPIENKTNFTKLLKKLNLLKTKFIS
jgi:hypothetical protein